MPRASAATARASAAKATAFSSKPAVGFKFLNLPPEIRRRVYEILLTVGTIEIASIDKWFRSENSSLGKPGAWLSRAGGVGLLTVSKQISEEARDVLYGRNNFVVFARHCASQYFIQIFGKENLRRIRNLWLLFPAEKAWLPRNFEASVLQPLLAGLRTLCLVPIESEDIWFAYDKNGQLTEVEFCHPAQSPPLPEGDPEDTKWVRHIFGYLAENMEETTALQVDPQCATKQTTDLLARYFPRGYMMVNTWIGFYEPDDNYVYDDYYGWGDFMANDDTGPNISEYLSLD